MKEFAIYTGLRIMLFIGSLLVVMLVWSLLNGSREVPAVWAVVIAFALSGVLSYYLLHRQRDAFARRVEERASRASAAFEERRAREDDD